MSWRPCWPGPAGRRDVGRNPESLLTDLVRRRLEAGGAHFVKLSDRFTRGVPDALVFTDRLVLVEFKAARLGGDSWSTGAGLGLTGAQDHHLRMAARRDRSCACVVTGTSDGSCLALWVPVRPESEQIEWYRRVAVDDEVHGWLEGRAGNTCLT